MSSSPVFRSEPPVNRNWNQVFKHDQFGGVRLDDITIIDDASRALLKLVDECGFDFRKVDRIVCPAMNAITLATCMAKRISDQRRPSGLGSTCNVSYVAIEGSFYGKRVLFKKSNIMKGERILVVDDTIDTGETAKAIVRAVEDQGGDLVPFVAVLVNQSGLAHAHASRGQKGATVISLVNRQNSLWK